MNQKKYYNLVEVNEKIKERGINLSYIGLFKHKTIGMLRSSGTMVYVGNKIPAYTDEDINEYVERYREYKKPKWRNLEK